MPLIMAINTDRRLIQIKDWVNVVFNTVSTANEARLDTGNRRKAGLCDSCW